MSQHSAPSRPPVLVLAGIALLILASVIAAGEVSGLVEETPLRFRRYDTDDGLPSPSIRCLAQDHLGFLWIGTVDGLVRFDGHAFRIFESEPDRADSISSNEIKALLVDAKGRLWVGTRDSGLNLFDQSSRTFTHFRRDPSSAGGPCGDRITALLETSAGEIWVGTGDGGAYRLAPDTQAISCYRHDPQRAGSLSSDAVSGIIESSSGELWVATFDAGLNLLERDRQSFIAFPLATGDERVPVRRINTIFEDSRGELWVGTFNSGLIRIDRSRQAVRQYRPDPGNPASLGGTGVKVIAEDSTGRLWIGMWGAGVDCFDPAREAFTHHRNHPDDWQSLSDNRVMTVATDNLGQIWVGTIDGLNVHDPTQQAFALFRHQTGNANTLIDNKVQAVCEDRGGRLWIGTVSSGLSRFDPSSGIFHHFVHDPDDPHSLASSEIFSLYEDSEGNLWIGTARGLHRHDPVHDRFMRYQRDPDDPAPFSGTNILAIHRDSIGDLWLGTWEGGLNRFEPQTGACDHYLPDDDNPTSLPQAAIWAITEDRQGQLWIATLGGGVGSLDPFGGLFMRYQHDPQDPSSLSHNTVPALLADSKGRIWVATAAGLDRFKPTTGGFEHFQEEDFDFNVTSIVEDVGGAVWIGTDRGAARLFGTPPQLTWFDAADGLQGDRFTMGAAHCGRSGTIYLGGPEGLSAFDPAKVGEHTEVPPVVLTDFLLLNRPVQLGEGSPLTRDIAFTELIVLGHTDYSFSFEFAALNLRQPEKNRYTYMLEGLDPSWVAADQKYRRATYTGIPAGTYTFRVRGSNDDGFWNEQGATVLVICLPPWWRTWWAYALYLLAAATLLSWTGVTVVRRGERKQQQKTRDILDGMVTEIRNLSSVDEVAGSVANHLLLAFQLKRVALVCRGSGSSTLIHTAGGLGAALEIPSRKHLLHALEGLSDSASYNAIRGQLSEEHRSWLDALEAAFFLTLVDSSNRPLGILILGDTVTQAGLTGQDRLLLNEVVPQVSIVLENLVLQAKVERGEKEREEVLARFLETDVKPLRQCPTCGRCFDADESVCPDDSSALEVPHPVERYIDGRYRLNRLLGAGGMGAVYEASDTLLKRPVAVKIMVGTAGHSREAMSRFERESRAAGGLKHPNIVAVHDCGRIRSDAAFLVMELVDGPTLRSELLEAGRIHPALVAQWLDQLLEAVGAAHEQGIIHRDLKPENILIAHGDSGQPQVKLLDFGLARIKGIDATTLESLTRPGAILGTLAYMSPEQLHGNPVDERTDLFATAVIAYECIVGKRPFSGTTPMQLITSILGTKVELPGKKPGHVALAEVLRRGLAKDPVDRFRSAGELQDALIPALRACPSLPLQARFDPQATQR